ncbi:hypothetical protein F5141DRAFT_820540 [Pisolithus sp. B1]|nr:hypothetical protein F5141DRAFT_820540 [Pisolithus sp. B1]
MIFCRGVLSVACSICFVSCSPRERDQIKGTPFIHPAARPCRGAPGFLHMLWKKVLPLASPRESTCLSSKPVGRVRWALSIDNVVTGIDHVARSIRHSLNQWKTV